eukprot:scaffold123770_cov71-Cyclotella_meneghiniana.AAC.9
MGGGCWEWWEWEVGVVSRGSWWQWTKERTEGQVRGAPRAGTIYRGLELERYLDIIYSQTPRLSQGPGPRARLQLLFGRSAVILAIAGAAGVIHVFGSCCRRWVWDMSMVGLANINVREEHVRVREEEEGQGLMSIWWGQFNLHKFWKPPPKMLDFGVGSTPPTIPPPH